MKQEIKPLTSLKAVGAALVFFYHFIYLRQRLPATNLFEAVIQNGFIGVTMFFVLSGFVLTLQYADKLQTHEFRWGDYLIRRIARIGPVYFFILALIALWGVKINLYNITFLQGFFSHYVQTGIIVTWTLTAELTFYLLFPPILVMMLRLFKRLPGMAVYLFLFSVLMVVLGYGLVNISNALGLATNAGFMSDNTFMLYRTVFGYIFDFSVGIFVAMLYKRRGRSFGKLPSVALIILGAGGIVFLQWQMVAVMDDVLITRLLMYGAALCVGLLVLGLTNAETPIARVMSWSPFVYLGRLSYTVYLLQLTQLLWPMQAWPVVWFYAGTNVLSMLIYEFIEKPARNFIVKITTTRPSNKQITAAVSRPTP